MSCTSLPNSKLLMIELGKPHEHGEVHDAGHIKVQHPPSTVIPARNDAVCPKSDGWCIEVRAGQAF